jgi:hypothetical protein
MVMKNVSGDQVVLKRGDEKGFSDPVFRTKAADQVFGDHIIHDSINN